jgi:hypothetical protein
MGKTVVWLGAFLMAALPAWSQVLRIEFSGEVTLADVLLLPGVTVGSPLNGRVEVDLAQLPEDNYYGGGHPGYTIQFSAGPHTVLFDSINASRDPGLTPVIFLNDEGGNYDWVGFQLRNQDDPLAVTLRFEDVIPPFTLVNGNYLPESIHLPTGLPRATFTYFNNFGSGTVQAKVLSATMTIDGVEGVTAILLWRVTNSNLQAQQKRALLSMLQAAEQEFAEGDCQAALRYLEKFEKRVRAQVEKSDPELARRLIVGAQTIIAAGCGE